MNRRKNEKRGKRRKEEERKYEGNLGSNTQELCLVNEAWNDGLGVAVVQADLAELTGWVDGDGVVGLLGPRSALLSTTVVIRTPSPNFFMAAWFPW